MDMSIDNYDICLQTHVIVELLQAFNKFLCDVVQQRCNLHCLLMILFLLNWEKLFCSTKHTWCYIYGDLQ